MMESVLFSFPVNVQMPSNACCKLLSMACGMIFCDRVFWHSNENRQPDSGAVVHRQVLLGTSYWTTHWLRTTKGQFSCRYLTDKLSAAASLDPEQKLPNSGKTPQRYFQSMREPSALQNGKKMYQWFHFRVSFWTLFQKDSEMRWSIYIPHSSTTKRFCQHKGLLSPNHPSMAKPFLVSGHHVSSQDDDHISH